MNVRAKFKCTSTTKSMGGVYDLRGKYTSGIVHEFKFSVVTGDTEENKKFFSSTPSGNVTLTSVRDDLFEIGKEYYLDFSPFVEPPPAPAEPAEE